MDSKIFYYARVSSRDQNLSRQIEAFKKMGANERDIFFDQKSGKDVMREKYMLLKNDILRSGDTLIITSLDRLSRNKNDIKNELEYFREKNIILRILDIPTTMMDIVEGQEWVWNMVNSILIEVLGTMAEQERIKILTRQREGIEAMKIVDGNSDALFFVTVINST